MEAECAWKWGRLSTHVSCWIGFRRWLLPCSWEQVGQFGGCCPHGPEDQAWPAPLPSTQDGSPCSLVIIQPAWQEAALIFLGGNLKDLKLQRHSGSGVTASLRRGWETLPKCQVIDRKHIYNLWRKQSQLIPSCLFVPAFIWAVFILQVN